MAFKLKLQQKLTRIIVYMLKYHSIIHKVEEPVNEAKFLFLKFYQKFVSSFTQDVGYVYIIMVM